MGICMSPFDSGVRAASNSFRSLTTKLPFDDDEFDHVHIRGIARAVPENKVRQSFRVLGSIHTKSLP